MGNYHKRNLQDAGDLLSLSALQASLPLPGQKAAPVPPTTQESAGFTHNERPNETALHISDLQVASATTPVPDFSTVVPSNDLEAFLNESGSDSEGAAPPSYAAPSTKQGKSSRRAVVESSDDDDDEEDDQDRFASYSISKKSRSERRRQQKEDLRQLNAALDKSPGWDGVENEPSTPSATGVAASDSSFGTSDVMEAIRKAQEEAMRMLPTASAPADDAESSSSKKRHKHNKHKKEHKHKKREGEDGPKEKSSKKSSRKSGSSSRSKKRRPHVEDDVE